MATDTHKPKLTFTHQNHKTDSQRSDDALIVGVARVVVKEQKFIQMNINSYMTLVSVNSADDVSLQHVCELLIGPCASREGGLEEVMRVSIWRSQY